MTCHGMGSGGDTASSPQIFCTPNVESNDVSQTRGWRSVKQPPPLLGGTQQRQDVRARTQRIEVVRPGLHHLPPLGESLRAVVRGTHFVALGMGELEFNQVGMPALLVQQRGRRASEPVAQMETRSDPRR
jgi:hypothetical protein